MVVPGPARSRVPRVVAALVPITVGYLVMRTTKPGGAGLVVRISDVTTTAAAAAACVACATQGGCWAVERDRLAADLNDRVIRRLVGTGLQLVGVTRLLTNPEAVSRVDAVIDELDATIREIRSASYARHSHPDEVGS